MVNQIPLIGDLYRWWSNRSERQEIVAATTLFNRQLQAPEEAVVNPLTQKTVALLERGKDNPDLKTELAALERVYFTFLSKSAQPLPFNYQAKENREMVDKFEKMGISLDFMRAHPEFLSTARQRFWQYYFPFVKIPVAMLGSELYIPFETAENSKKFEWKPWSSIKEMDLDNIRVTYQGICLGHPDQSSHFVPLKEVDSDGKYAIQFVTSCPVGRGLPSSLDFKTSGHSFTQIIVPKRDASKSEVFSIGFYPRKLADIGFQFFKTVPGVYRNHDPNVSRIQAKQIIPIIKQYVFDEDSAANPCLFSIVKNMAAVCQAYKDKGLQFDPISMDQIDRAMTDRNEPELDRIFISLTEARQKIVQGELNVHIQPMGREEKAMTMIRRYEEAQGKHPYHILGYNCTAVSYQQEAFAVGFLDAKQDFGKSVKVYDSQVDIHEYQFGILDRIRDIFERVVLHFFAAMPLTGLILGSGSTHKDAEHLKSEDAIPSFLSETAFATHQLLSAPFTRRALFPAGEILAQDTPVIQPPGFFSRLKYLYERGSLLK